MSQFLPRHAAGIRDGRVPPLLASGGRRVRRGAAALVRRPLPAAREPRLAAGPRQARARRRCNALAAQDATGVPRVSIHPKYSDSNQMLLKKAQKIRMSLTTTLILFKITKSTMRVVLEKFHQKYFVWERGKNLSIYVKKNLKTKASFIENFWLNYKAKTQYLSSLLRKKLYQGLTLT